MFDLGESVVLGIVQGATEFLPISSSGHLVIAQHLFGMTEPALFFDIILHLGTLLAVFIYYRADLTAAVVESWEALAALKKGMPWGEVNERYHGFRLAWLVVAGSVPTGLIGITFKDRFEAMFGSVTWVGIMLAVTGTLLLATRWFPVRRHGIAAVTLVDVLIIGVAQGLAITPGISRSGTTIAAALMLGIGRETAARFSFILSIPSIAGALVLQFDPAAAEGDPLPLLTGFATSALVGYACLWLLVLLVRQGRFSWFAGYCFAAAAVTLLFIA